MSGAGDAAPRLLVTGARGFLGGAVVAAALSAGCAVRAVLRGAGDAPPGADLARIDLAAPDARAALDAALDNVDCVVHAAAAMAGDDGRHARDTVAATETLIDAMTARAPAPRLVLISSVSVYNYASAPAWSQIDETTPLEPQPELRDAYCRAKLAQEALARRAAQRRGLRAQALRPGAIFGPGHVRTARLGLALGPLLVTPGGGAPTPAISVSDCAALIVRAALRLEQESDLAPLEGDGRFEAINLVGRDQPTQKEWIAAIRGAGWPKATLRAPARIARAPAQAAALAGIALPGLVRRLPGPLRLESFDARFKPVRFSPARAEDRLGGVPEGGALEALRVAARDVAT